MKNPVAWFSGAEYLRITARQPDPCTHQNSRSENCTFLEHERRRAIELFFMVWRGSL
jgi:hypothetical protein